MIMSTKEICKRGLSMTISLTLGNTRLPLAHRLVGDKKPLRQLLLRPALFLSEAGYEGAEFSLVEFVHAFSPRLQHSPRRACSQPNVGRIAVKA